MTKYEPFNFDMIDACGYGYVRVWHERHYLIRLALVPVMIKFVATLAVYLLHYEDNLLRQGLIMLPAAFAQGWVLAQFLRTLLCGERWPQQLPTTRDDAVIAKLILRARGIISSTLVFVLIQIISIVAFWAMTDMQAQVEAVQDQPSMTSDEASAVSVTMASVMMVPAIATLFLAIWAFRLSYLYIPYAVLMPVREYLARISGFMSSVWMLALFLVTLIPCAVTASLLSAVVASALSGGAETLSPMAQFVISILRTITDMVTALIGTAAMTYALRNVVPHGPNELKDVSGKSK